MKMRLNMLPVMLLARNIIAFPVKSSLPVLAGMVLLALSACSPPETVLPGDRIAVFAGIESITPNQDAFDEGAGLPATSGLASATHAGGSAAHAGGHLDIDLPLKKYGQHRLALVAVILSILPSRSLMVVRFLR